MRAAPGTIPLWLVLGSSGSGKSAFGAHLAGEGWLHLEVDQFRSVREEPADGMDVHGLRKPWDRFYEYCDPAPLAAELQQRAQGKAGCVLTFPSGVLLTPRHFEQQRLRVVILFGDQADCLASFLERERAIKRNLGYSFWRTYNTLAYLVLGLPEYAPWRYDVFAGGRRRPHAEVAKEIAARG